MANELNILTGTPGQTVTVNAWFGGVVVTAGISIPEVAGRTDGFYSGNMTGVAHYYSLEWLVNGVPRAASDFNWDGSAEILSGGGGGASAASVATAIFQDLFSSSDFSTTGSFGAWAKANIAQGGDVYAQVGFAGAGLTALGDTRIGHLNADVTSRMATYTQPTGFLAAAFPSGTVANTTNITAGTVTTVSGNVSGTVASVLAPVQVNNIGESSAALNAVASAFTQTTGSVTSGTYASTATLDGVSHVTADTAGTLDEYYDFSIDTTGQIGTSFQFEGYLAGVTNTLKVFAYNWTNSAWDQIGTLTGLSTTTDQQYEYDLINSHTSGTGIVRIRFQNTGLTTASLVADRLLAGYTTVYSFPMNFALQSIDSSGRVLLQPTQAGVTIPTVTTVTGGATSSQLFNIAVTSAALSAATTAFNKTTGSVTSGTYTDTATLDGTAHVTADSAGTLDEYYDALIGLSHALGVSVLINCYLVGATNSLKVYAYNWSNAAWDQIGNITGGVTTTFDEYEFPLVNSHTNPSDMSVRIRFANTGLMTASLHLDRMLVGFTVVAPTPTNFSSLNIDSSGRTLLQPTQTGVTIPIVTTLTNLPAAPTDWLTGASVKADAVTKIQAGLATPTNITAGTMTNLTNAPTAGDLTAAMKTSVTTAATAATPTAAGVTGLTTTTIAVAIWNTIIASGTQAGTIMASLLTYLTGYVAAPTAAANATAAAAAILANSSNKLATNSDGSVTASVDTGTIVTDILGGLSGATITIISPLSQNGTVLHITRGDSYSVANGMSLKMNIVSAPDLIGTVPHFRINGVDLTTAPAIVSATQLIVFNDVLTAQTNALPVSSQLPYQIRFELSPDVSTQLAGLAVVQDGI